MQFCLHTWVFKLLGSPFRSVLGRTYWCDRIPVRGSLATGWYRRNQRLSARERGDASSSRAGMRLGDASSPRVGTRRRLVLPRGELLILYRIKINSVRRYGSV
ncbi:hypothetical protein GW17_00044127 [Ensete ventricosum]|nr:hypothetical protein GW17_00044127 [Ensete ventricosum]